MSLYGTEWRERGYGLSTLEAGLPAAPAWSQENIVINCTKDFSVCAKSVYT